MPERVQGTVRWFNHEKEYGFIKPENGSDVFVHASAIQAATLKEGDKVEFEIVETEKGLQANKVTIVTE